MTALRDFSCGVCGAPRTSIDEAMFVACTYCGALLDVAGGRWLDPDQQAAELARGHALAFWASRASGRFHALGQALDAEPADGPRFRALAEEYNLVYALVFPDRLPPEATGNAVARAAWARRAAVTAAITRFDPDVAAAWRHANAALGGFDRRASAGDVVAAAQVALERMTRAYDALRRHPETLADYPQPSPHYARIAVRSSLLAMLATFDDPDVYARVAVEVLGDRPAGDACARCGAPLGEAVRDLWRCPHCGAVVERLADEPWLRARLGLVAAALPDLHRQGRVDSYVAALAVLHTVGSFERAGAGRVAALIARAIPWLSADELARGAALFRDLLDDAGRRVLDAALAALAPWTPDPSLRPAPPPPPAEAFDPDGWLAKARALWGYARDRSILAALGIAIADLLASLPGARPPITAALALRFLDEALAGIPRTAWHAAIAPLVPGYADTPAGPLVAELAQILAQVPPPGPLVQS